MSDNAILFRMNQQDLLQEQRILPPHMDMNGAFSAAANNNSIAVVNIEPQKPEMAADLAADRIGLMNTVMAPNEILTNPPQNIQMPAKGEINELGRGVAGAALEAATLLFDSVFKPDQNNFEDFAAETERKLAMNMAPRPPTIGMGLGGGPGA